MRDSALTLPPPLPRPAIPPPLPGTASRQPLARRGWISAACVAGVLHVTIAATLWTVWTGRTQHFEDRGITLKSVSLKRNDSLQIHVAQAARPIEPAQKAVAAASRKTQLPASRLRTPAVRPPDASLSAMPDIPDAGTALTHTANESKQKRLADVRKLLNRTSGGTQIVGCDESCELKTHGTEVSFFPNAAAASKQANQDSKLVLLLHISGNFAREEFT